MSRRFSVVIPAYNEERTIERAVRETRAFFDTLKMPYQIIVADDGSHDRTAAIVQKMMRSAPMLDLVRLQKNQGKGAAVRAGALASDGDVLLFLDSDLATHPSELKKFLPYLDTFDVLIGSRRVNGARIVNPQPWYRTLSGRIFNVLVRFYLDIPFHDTQCGFKIFIGPAKRLFKEMKSSGWAFDVELLMLARRKKFRIKEVPVRWHHGTESRVRMTDFFHILEDLRELKMRFGGIKNKKRAA